MKKDKVFIGIIAGAKEVMQHKSQLNRINVFPVADGDTGSNLYSTMNSIVVHSKVSDTLKSTLESVADAAIVGARGNSGIIFAQYLQGFSQGINGEEFTSETFVSASGIGVEYAYTAVVAPVEGTILTIMRVFHDTLLKYYKEDLESALDKAYQSVLHAVEKTTDQLKVLKKASVVDSGAKGFQMFIRGFIKGLKGDFTIELDEDVPMIEHFHDDNFKHRYCTEALIKNIKVDVRSLLKPFGDSLIVAGSERKTRIHIHTDHPSEVFSVLSDKGLIIEPKVEDMQKQHDLMNHRKHNRVIVTDSIADLPQQIIDDEQVHIMHLNILIGEENYIDKLTIENERILALSHLKPTSSLPTLKTIENMYEYLSTYYDEIIVLCVSKELSGTYSVIKKFASNYEKMHVIDTKQNSVAQGVLVHQCIDYLNTGFSTEAILDAVENDIEHSKILVKVDSIEPMISSGRLSVKMGSIVKRIGIKPIVTLKSGEGAIESIGFNKSHALRKIIKHLKNEFKVAQFKKLGITYVDDPTEAYQLRESLMKAGIGVDFVVKSSAIIANGAGKHAIAVGYIRER